MQMIENYAPTLALVFIIIIHTNVKFVFKILNIFLHI